MNKLTKRDVAQKLGLGDNDLKYVDKLEKLGYLHFVNGRRKRKFVDEKEFQTMLTQMKDTKKYERILKLIFDLWEMCKKGHISFPGALKGQIGELKTLTKLIEKFPESRILYFGGTTPKVDILLDGKKIQVKTQYPEGEAVRRNYEKYGVRAFGSPTVRIENPKTLHVIGKTSAEMWDKGTRKRKFGFDYLILTIIRGKTPEFYVFDAPEVQEYFKSFGCYSGKYGDVTIICIESTTNEEKANEIKAMYPPDMYTELFERARVSAWQKIRV